MNLQNLIQPFFYLRRPHGKSFKINYDQDNLVYKDIMQKIHNVGERQFKVNKKDQLLFLHGKPLDQNSLALMFLSIKVSGKFQNNIIHLVDQYKLDLIKKKGKITFFLLQVDLGLKDQKNYPSSSKIKNLVVDTLQGDEQFAEQFFVIYAGKKLNQQKTFEEQMIENSSHLYFLHKDQHIKDQKKLELKKSTMSLCMDKNMLKSVFSIVGIQNKDENKSGNLQRKKIQIHIQEQRQNKRENEIKIVVIEESKIATQETISTNPTININNPMLSKIQSSQSGPKSYIKTQRCSSTQITGQKTCFYSRDQQIDALNNENKKLTSKTFQLQENTNIEAYLSSQKPYDSKYKKGNGDKQTQKTDSRSVILEINKKDIAIKSDKKRKGSKSYNDFNEQEFAAKVEQNQSQVDQIYKKNASELIKSKNVQLLNINKNKKQQKQENIWVTDLGNKIKQDNSQVSDQTQGTVITGKDIKQILDKTRKKAVQKTKIDLNNFSPAFLKQFNGKINASGKASHSIQACQSQVLSFYDDEAEDVDESLILQEDNGVLKEEELYYDYQPFTIHQDPEEDPLCLSSVTKSIRSRSGQPILINVQFDKISQKGSLDQKDSIVKQKSLTHFSNTVGPSSNKMSSSHENERVQLIEQLESVKSGKFGLRKTQSNGQAHLQIQTNLRLPNDKNNQSPSRADSFQIKTVTNSNTVTNINTISHHYNTVGPNTFQKEKDARSVGSKKVVKKESSKLKDQQDLAELDDPLLKGNHFVATSIQNTTSLNLAKNSNFQSELDSLLQENLYTSVMGGNANKNNLNLNINNLKSSQGSIKNVKTKSQKKLLNLQQICERKSQQVENDTNINDIPENKNNQDQNIFSFRKKGSQASGSVSQFSVKQKQKQDAKSIKSLQKQSSDSLSKKQLSIKSEHQQKQITSLQKQKKEKNQEKYIINIKKVQIEEENKNQDNLNVNPSTSEIACRNFFTDRYSTKLIQSWNKSINIMQGTSVMIQDDSSEQDSDSDAQQNKKQKNKKQIQKGNLNKKVLTNDQSVIIWKGDKLNLSMSSNYADDQQSSSQGSQADSQQDIQDLESKGFLQKNNLVMQSSPPSNFINKKQLNKKQIISENKKRQNEQAQQKMKNQLACRSLYSTEFQKKLFVSWDKSINIMQGTSVMIQDDSSEDQQKGQKTNKDQINKGGLRKQIKLSNDQSVIIWKGDANLSMSMHANYNSSSQQQQDEDLKIILPKINSINQVRSEPSLQNNQNNKVSQTIVMLQKMKDQLACRSLMTQQYQKKLMASWNQSINIMQGTSVMIQDSSDQQEQNKKDNQEKQKFLGHKSLPVLRKQQSVIIWKGDNLNLSQRSVNGDNQVQSSSDEDQSQKGQKKQDQQMLLSNLDQNQNNEFSYPAIKINTVKSLTEIKQQKQKEIQDKIKTQLACRSLFTPQYQKKLMVSWNKSINIMQGQSIMLNDSSQDQENRSGESNKKEEQLNGFKKQVKLTKDQSIIIWRGSIQRKNSLQMSKRNQINNQQQNQEDISSENDSDEQDSKLINSLINQMGSQNGQNFDEQFLQKIDIQNQKDNGINAQVNFSQKNQKNILNFKTNINDQSNTQSNKDNNSTKLNKNLIKKAQQDQRPNQNSFSSNGSIIVWRTNKNFSRQTSNSSNNKKIK